MISEVLEGVLLASVALLVPATIGLFTVRGTRQRRAATTWSRGGVAATVVAVAALGAGALVGLEPVPATGFALLVGVTVLVWVPVAGHWATRGLVAWTLTVDVALAYLAYVVHWTTTAGLGVLGTGASVALLALEAFMLLIGAGYVWELVDVLARRTWSAADVSADAPLGSHRPFVSLHVPTHNEPPDLVIATVEALLALDYDDYEILVVDNNTEDPLLWRPVEEWCRGRARVRFLHLANWPGFKSGALNEALRVADPRAELIGIVDADYLVDPDFLARCAPLFADPEVAFVQTPQDYRDWDVAPYFRRLYRSYAYFFDVSQRSRAERNGAIFGGTMGLIRRSAMEDAGGWDEWCITEDAELSLRLLRAGGRGLHVDRSFGRGLMPLTFEALKRQRFRWCFGGVQILRMHWRTLLPGRRTTDNRLDLGQRWAYFVGGLQWFGDLASVLFTGFLLVGAADLVLGTGLVVRRMSGLLIACVLVLVVLGALRSLALVRRTSGAGWGESLGAFGIWLALSWTVALASFRGLTAREGVFLRTPKVKGDLGWRDALRGNRVELGLGLVCLVVGGVVAARGEVAAAAVAALLVVHAAGYLAAPVNSLAAIRSDLPEELRRRRREAVSSWGTRSARRGGLVLAGTGAVLVAFIGFAAPVQGPQLPAIGDRFEDLTGPDERVADDTPSEPATTPAGTGSAGSTIGSTTPSIGSVVPVATSAAAAGPTARPSPRVTSTAAVPTSAVPSVRPTPTSRTTPPAPSPPAAPATGKPTAKPTQASTGGKPTAKPSPTRSGGRP